MEMDLPSSLLSLPYELQLKIIALLSPTDILSLSQTCSIANNICSDKLIWRQQVHAVLSEHDPTLQNQVPGVPGVPLDYGADAGTWFKQASFLIPRSKWLGYWASSRPHKSVYFTHSSTSSRSTDLKFVNSSRIIRLSASYSREPHSSADSTTLSLTITASLLTPHNAFESATPPPLPLPLGAQLDPTGAAYQSPLRGPGSYTPDRGLSVDVLSPTYSFTPFFTISSSSPDFASLIVAPGSRTQGLKVQLKSSEIEISNEEAPRNEHERARREHENIYGLFTGRVRSPSWPTKWLVGAERAGRSVGALRGLFDRMNGEMGEISEEKEEGGGLICRGFGMEPRKGREETAAVGTSTGVEVRQRQRVAELRDEVPRRMRGVGPNGGPGILWQGAERDPEGRPGVAIIRVGGGGGEEILFRVGNLDAVPDELDQVEPDLEFFEAFGNTQRTPRAHLPPLETYIPIQAPHRPLTSTSPSSTDSAGDILASSLEGLWCATIL
ncbi:hypothetical protein P7C70_g6992, partial [Phenoliferia sp. Uapishka_3]